MRTCARHGVPNVLTTEDPGVWIAERSDNSTQETADNIGSLAGTTTAPSGSKSTNRKICAIGVQVSRGVTSHGVGFNVFDSPIQGDATIKKLYTLPKANIYAVDPTGEQAPSTAQPEDSTIPAPGYLSWGFSRIVACGLEGKSVTWLSRERQDAQEGQGVQTTQPAQPPGEPTLERVADSLAIEVARSLKIEEGDIDKITDEDILDGT